MDDAELEQFDSGAEELIERLAAYDPDAAVFPRAAHMALLEGRVTPGSTRLLGRLEQLAVAEVRGPMSEGVYSTLFAIKAAREGHVTDDRRWAWQRSRIYRSPPADDDVMQAYRCLYGLLLARLEGADENDPSHS